MTILNKKNQENIANLSNEQLKELDKAERKKISKDHKWAIEILNQILYDDPWCVYALEELADNLLSLDEIDKALQAAEFVLTLTTKSYWAYYLAWFIYSKKWNYKKSIELLKKANELRPNNPEVLRCYWWSLFMSGQRWKWIVLLERAKNLHPKDTQVLNDLAACMIDIWNVQKWLDLLDEIQEIDPENQRAVHALDFLKKNLNKIK